MSIKQNTMKFLNRALFVMILIATSATLTYGQLSKGGTPLSFSFSKPGKKSIAVYSIADYDYKNLLEEDKFNKRKAFRYGMHHKVEINPSKDGSWYSYNDNEHIWQIKVVSKNAYSLSLVFDDFRLKANAKLFVYNSEKTQILGAFTPENNKKDGWFSIAPIPGEEIIIELNTSDKNNYGCLNISGVIHDYKGVFGLKGYGTSGYCNVNINCPDGDEWQNEKRAVVKIIADGYLCSGALVNNTANDTKPYLLTAEHCINNEATASQAIFWFNYESDNCVSTGNPGSDRISSADLLATGGNIDFSLLELSVTPPKSFNVYYAGWSRETVPPQSSVTIHHPDGDIKKISIDEDPAIIDSYGDGYLNNSHWKITDWEVGTTEGGSSGGPLFNSEHLIVGDLTGGDASCSYNYNDYYSRFDYAWNYYSNPSKHLETWLDPLNIGVLKLNGFDPELIVNGLNAAVSAISEPNEAFCSREQVSPEIVVQNRGTETITSLNLSLFYDENKVVTKSWSGQLETGENIVVNMEPVHLPAGNSIVKAIISDPNGVKDPYPFNDTLTKYVFGQDLIDEVNIIGDTKVCSENLLSKFNTDLEGSYKWTVNSGRVDGEDTLRSVEIVWDEWGDRTVNLSVSNLCNSINTGSVEVDVVEQAIELDIDILRNGTNICWSLEDCHGEVIAEDCELPESGNYKNLICVSRGCYKFYISAENLSIKNYSLNNLITGQEITLGTNVAGTEVSEFILNAAINEAFINLYPNPATDVISIEASFMEIYDNSSFAIYNNKGAQVTPFNDFDERKVVNISSLPPGMYTVKIVSIYGDFSKKFVKP